INMDQYLRMDNQDTLELLVQAKDNFLKKDERTIPIPQSVREVMYRHRWDKVIVDVRRLVYRTKNNKREQYTAMVASGNQKGLLGLGMGSAETAQLAVARAYLDSFSNLAAVPLYRGHTVYHHVEHHFQRVKVTLSPRTSGWGLRCSNLFYELCSLAGIRDLTVDVSGATRNKFFVAKAFFDALQKQTAPHDGVEGTGVYVKEVVRRPVVNLGTYRNNGTLPPKEYLAT
uniref:uS5m n=1 Tax=Polytomella magna TaxID=353565 RepID=UPI002240E464|nr:Chain Be, uS5m [Polytomella magna]8APN_Be Chain Be, uS5m [Polytomella magna]8APO_Be Chain Be, uS5m [Polytomella magna]